MRGFTLTELLITIAISAILAVVAVPIYGNLQVSSQLNETSSLLIQTIRTARENSEASVNNSAHGIKINEHSYILYQGSSYATRQANYDRITELDSTLTLSSNLTDDEVNFSKGLALPNHTGVIILTHDLGNTKNISINTFGLIQED